MPINLFDWEAAWIPESKMQMLYNGSLGIESNKESVVSVCRPVCLSVGPFEVRVQGLVRKNKENTIHSQQADDQQAWKTIKFAWRRCLIKPTLITVIPTGLGIEAWMKRKNDVYLWLWRRDNQHSRRLRVRWFQECDASGVLVTKTINQAACPIELSRILGHSTCWFQYNKWCYSFFLIFLYWLTQTHTISCLLVISDCNHQPSQAVNTSIEYITPVDSFRVLVNVFGLF